MNQKTISIGLVLIIVVSLTLFLSGCVQQSQGGGGVKISECEFPNHKLKVSISPTRCQQLHQDCDFIRVYATSPQITSLFASGKPPCSSMSKTSNACSISGVYYWSRHFCMDESTSACMKGFTTGVAEDFGGAIIHPSIKITDTVNYCAVASDGTPLGCVSSLVDQCNPDATILLLIN